MAEYIGTAYPKEVASVVRDQTFSVYSELSLAKAADGKSPLKVYSDFSRYVLSLINSGKAVKANIPVEEIAEIMERSRIAQSMDLSAPFAAANRKPQEQKREILTPADSVVFEEFGSRTASEVLLNDADGESKLNALFKTLDREKDAKKVEAILDAAKRKKAGTLKSSPVDTGAAYSIRIANGNLKGKTPAEVAKEEGGREKLIKQKEWLAKNLSQYPDNQKQINAIEAALSLLESGGIEAADAPVAGTNGATISLYEALYRPLVRKTNENGKCFVYEIRIGWNIGNQYPVSVSITNYYAPVKKDAKGLFNVVAKEAEGKMKAEMLLSSKEWNNTLRAITANMTQFEVFHARDCINDAIDAEKRNRES